MAKRGTLDHPKNRRLARALKQPHGATLGLLETIWHQASQFHANGIMSRMDIEDALDAGGWLTVFTTDQIVSTLTDKNHIWLDVLPDGNFYIHDWHIHCDDATHAKLYRSVMRFGNGVNPKPAKVYGDEKAKLELIWNQLPPWIPAGYPPGALPSPSQPSLAQPSQQPPVVAAVVNGSVGRFETRQSVVDEQDDYKPGGRCLSQSLTFPVAALGGATKTFTLEVKEQAWEVCRLFAKYSPMRRPSETWVKIITPICNTILREPEAHRKLLKYFSETDPDVIATEVKQGIRCSPSEPMYRVCEKLFPLPPPAWKQQKDEDPMEVYRRARKQIEAQGAK